MKIRLGTRGSQLALVQAHMLKKALLSLNPSASVDIIVIKTTGDVKQGTQLADQSDKQDWIDTLEQALCAQKIDLALHSGKDVPCRVSEQTALLPLLERASPFDVFVGAPDTENRRLKFSTLPAGAKVGSASLRRGAQLRRLRPDLDIVPYRGNVPTRIDKLATNGVQGAVLAAAGLQRLQIPYTDCTVFSADELMPAVNQGILVAQFLADNAVLEQSLLTVVDQHTRQIWHAERVIAEALDGDCQSAMSIYAQAKNNSLWVAARVLAVDGTVCLERQATGELHQAGDLGLQVAEQLLKAGAKDVLKGGCVSANS
jgi:hydroxymethylbilane synthase